LVTDERYYGGRRVKLPERFTGGAEVFVVYIVLTKNLLPGGMLQEPWVDCLATPGQEGEILLTAAVKDYFAEKK
jgi:hypothetical protein